jgi:hypothetical protein
MDITIFKAFAAPSFMHTIDKKYDAKYINKLKIKATLVLSINDWKKYIIAKTSIVHRNTIINKK